MNHHICAVLFGGVLLLPCVVLAGGAVGADGWWNTSWQYRRAITINNTENPHDLFDYQVRIVVPRFKGMNYNFSDIRFTYKEGMTESEINYWIENFTNESAIVWVKVPFIPKTSNTTIYMYYGNKNATSESNGSAVFEFFDDFQGLDASNWVEVVKRNKGNYSLIKEDNITYLKVWDDAQHCDILDVWLKSRVINLSQAVVEWRIKVLQVRSGNPSFGIIRATDGETIIWMNSCSAYDWWNFIILGRDYILNQDHRSSYIKDWGKVIMKFRDNYACVNLVPEGFVLDKTADFPISSFQIMICGGSCCYAGGYKGQHVFGYDYIFVRKYADPEPTATIGAEQSKDFYTSLDSGRPDNSYPSISGKFIGTIKTNTKIIATKLHTYPCEGTGGHTEHAIICNKTWCAEASWSGYEGDWMNIPFNKTVVLIPYETYNITIVTGSYPQIHHTSSLKTENGWINCTEFVDANGNKYNDWIPAIMLWS